MWSLEVNCFFRVSFRVSLRVLLSFKVSLGLQGFIEDTHTQKVVFSVSFRVSLRFTGSSGFKFGFHLKGFNQSFLGCRFL